MIGFQNYLEQERQIGKRTIAIYIFYYKHFNPLELSQDYVHEFIVKHKNTPSVRGFISNYLNYHGITTITIPRKAKGGNKVKKLIRTISRDELDTFRKFLYNKSFKQGLIFDLIYQGALRRFEVTTIKIGSFKWNDWFKDISAFCKLIILGKGNKERMVLINPETAEAIVNHYMKINQFSTMIELTGFLESNAERLLFKKSNGEPLTSQNVYDFIKRNSLIALKRDIRPHELRHERASELERKGVSVHDIKNYLGHARISTTEIYLHRTGEESIENIKEIIGN